MEVRHKLDSSQSAPLLLRLESQMVIGSLPSFHSARAVTLGDSLFNIWRFHLHLYRLQRLIERHHPEIHVTFEQNAHALPEAKMPAAQYRSVIVLEYRERTIRRLVRRVHCFLKLDTRNDRTNGLQDKPPVRSQVSTTQRACLASVVSHSETSRPHIEPLPDRLTDPDIEPPRKVQIFS